VTSWYSVTLINAPAYLHGRNRYFLTYFWMAEATQRSDTAMTLDFANWMAKLPAKMHGIPLRQLSIPGSHDSGGFYLDKNSSIAPGEGKTIKVLAHLFGSCAKNIIHNWSITQDLPIYDQLKHGIRYFDFRVAYDESTKKFYFVHGLYGLTYSKIFEGFKQFIKEHPKEVIILDFNHIYEFKAEQHSAFTKLIEENFQGKLYSSGTKGTNCSLNDIWGCGSNIIAFYDDDASTKKNPKFWSRKNIFSPWFNTDSVDTLIEDLNKRFGTIKEGCFNVFQAILSPQTSTIVKHLGGSLKNTLAKNCDQHVSSWLQNVGKEKKKGVNIVICDFIDLNEYPSKVIALNYSNAGDLVSNE